MTFRHIKLYQINGPEFYTHETFQFIIKIGFPCFDPQWIYLPHFQTFRGEKIHKKN